MISDSEKLPVVFDDEILSFKVLLPEATFDSPTKHKNTLHIGEPASFEEVRSAILSNNLYSTVQYKITLYKLNRGKPGFEGRVLRLEFRGYDFGFTPG